MVSPYSVVVRFAVRLRGNFFFISILAVSHYKLSFRSFNYLKDNVNLEKNAGKVMLFVFATMYISFIREIDLTTISLNFIKATFSSLLFLRDCLILPLRKDIPARM